MTKRGRKPEWPGQMTRLYQFKATIDLENALQKKVDELKKSGLNASKSKVMRIIIEQKLSACDVDFFEWALIESGDK